MAFPNKSAVFVELPVARAPNQVLCSPAIPSCHKLEIDASHEFSLKQSILNTAVSHEITANKKKKLTDKILKSHLYQENSPFRSGPEIFLPSIEKSGSFVNHFPKPVQITNHCEQSANLRSSVKVESSGPFPIRVSSGYTSHRHMLSQ